MKMHRRQIFFLILITLSIVAFLDSGAVVKELVFRINIDSNWNDQSFSLVNAESASYGDSCAISGESLEIFELYNNMGDISIIGEARDDIAIDYFVTTYAATEDLAAEYLDKIFIETQTIGTKAYIKQTIPSDSELQGVRVDFDIKVPHSLVIDLRASHGVIELRNLKNTVQADLKFGNDVTIENLAAETRLKIDHSNGRIVNINGKLNLETDFSQLNIDQITDNMKLASRHSDLRIDDVEQNLDVNSEFGKINFDNVLGDLDGRSRHCTVIGRDIGGTVDWQIDFGSLDLTGIASEVIIIGRHAPVDLELKPIDAGYRFDIDVDHAKLRTGLDLDKREISRTADNYVGSYAAGINSVEINSNFGNVTVRIR